MIDRSKKEVCHDVDNVFGISRGIPLNYVERTGVDDEFNASLKRRKHIVIYGASKQGKTSLRKKHLSDNQFIVVSCQSGWNLETLVSSFLKEAGFKVEVSTERAVSGVHKINVRAEAGIDIPFLSSTKAESGYEGENGQKTTTTFESLALDPLDGNDAIRALKGISFSKIIILEDFHYLPQETQESFTHILKAFYEKSDLVFIVVGVWREENRLIGFNGDLTDRVLSINADKWTKEQLLKVINAGEALMNVAFSDEFKASVIEESFEAVHLVQEACRKACLLQDIKTTMPARIDGPTPIRADKKVAKEIIKDIVSGQRGRYHGALQNITEGFRETDLDIPKWIVFAILNFEAEQLEKGIRLRSLSRVMKAARTDASLNNGSITQMLKALGSLQNKKGVRPLIFDYDAANTRLSVVDRGFVI